MANSWLRLWHDMPNDPKWRTIARISGQPIALVQAVYIHLLVDASRNVTRGHADVTIEDLASALDVTEESISAIHDAMQGRVLDGMTLSGWSARQPKREDAGSSESGAKSAAQRKREQRERDKEAQKSEENRQCHDESRIVTTDKDKDKETDKENTKATAAYTSKTVETSGDSPPVGRAEISEPPLPDGSPRFAVLIRQWEKQRGKFSKVTSGSTYLTAWAKKGVADGQLREAYDMAVADREINQDPTAVSAGFIDVFLAKVLNPPGGDSALNRAGAPAAAKHWAASWSGIVGKGAELGIEQGHDESPPAFKARVFAAADLSEEEKSMLRADYGVRI